MGLLPFLLRTPFGWLILLVVVGFVVLRGFFGGGSPSRSAQGVRGGDERVAFVSFVLDDNQDTWTRIFEEQGRSYERAKLVLFTDSTPTGCGFGRAATGPFYCPADRRVYLDLSFFRELETKLGARGDFAQAYVVAHEVGHHVQNVLGLSDRVRGPKSSVQGATGASVRLELQADCFAGIWAHGTTTRDLLEKGDLEEALGAAAAIGDDRLQKQATGDVAPDSFTHGTSAQRARWFQRGFESGRMADCDTFAASEL